MPPSLNPSHITHYRNIHTYWRLPSGITSVGDRNIKTSGVVGWSPCHKRQLFISRPTQWSKSRTLFASATLQRQSCLSKSSRWSGKSHSWEHWGNEISDEQEPQKSGEADGRWKSNSAYHQYSAGVPTSHSHRAHMSVDQRHMNSSARRALHWKQS